VLEGCREMVFYTKCNFKSVQSHSGIMPMNRNVKANRVGEDWTVTFLQSVLFSRYWKGWMAFAQDFHLVLIAACPPSFKIDPKYSLPVRL